MNISFLIRASTNTLLREYAFPHSSLWNCMTDFLDCCGRHELCLSVCTWVCYQHQEVVHSGLCKVLLFQQTSFLKGMPGKTAQHLQSIAQWSILTYFDIFSIYSTSGSFCGLALIELKWRLLPQLWSQQSVLNTKLERQQEKTSRLEPVKKINK